MSNETKWTPGPWIKVRHGDLRGVNGEQVVVWASGLAHGNRSETTMANAHLIATAPELYEALEKSLKALPIAGDSESQDALRFEIMDVLAKARGES